MPLAGKTTASAEEETAPVEEAVSVEESPAVEVVAEEVPAEEASEEVPADEIAEPMPEDGPPEDAEQPDTGDQVDEEEVIEAEAGANEMPPEAVGEVTQEPTPEWEEGQAAPDIGVDAAEEPPPEEAAIEEPPTIKPVEETPPEESAPEKLAEEPAAEVPAPAEEESPEEPLVEGPPLPTPPTVKEKSSVAQSAGGIEVCKSDCAAGVEGVQQIVDGRISIFLGSRCGPVDLKVTSGSETGGDVQVDLSVGLCTAPCTTSGDKEQPLASEQVKEPTYAPEPVPSSEVLTTEEILAEEAPPEESPAEQVLPEETPAEYVPPEEISAEKAPPEEVTLKEAPPEDISSEEASAKIVPVEETPPEDSPPDEITPQEATKEEIPTQEPPSAELLADDAALPPENTKDMLVQTNLSFKEDDGQTILVSRGEKSTPEGEAVTEEQPPAELLTVEVVEKPTEPEPEPLVQVKTTVEAREDVHAEVVAEGDCSCPDGSLKNPDGAICAAVVKGDAQLKLDITETDDQTKKIDVSVWFQ